MQCLVLQKILFQILGKCTTYNANSSNEWQDGGQDWVDTLFISGNGNKGSPLTLPSGVAFELGVKIKSLILQVHFKPFENYKEAMGPVGVDLYYTGMAI